MTEIEPGVPAPDGPANLIDTEYRIGQHNITRRWGPFDVDVHNPVFVVSAGLIVFLVLVTIAFGADSKVVFAGLRDWLTAHLDWFFLLVGDIFVIVPIAIIFSPWGRIRIGGADARPDFSTSGWFAMLFAAGMGIGLMFYGVSEPIGHFDAAMAGTSAAPLAGSVVVAGHAEAARRLAMAATIFHWALHPWAIYAVLALALSIFSFNKGLPLTMRSVFYPVFGERVWGWPGHVIDILAVLATLFGLATSLGLGAQQAAAGLTYLFGHGVAAEGTRTLWGFAFGNAPATGVANDSGLLVILIAGITAMALTSVVLGVEAGVKRISEINMVLAGVLLLFVIAVGPTWSIISGFFLNLGAYLAWLPSLADPFGRSDDAFRQGWTAFYWAWWISWSPFVGMFIARVSRGRTVREFLIAVLIVPSVVSVLWMTAFGGTAISQIVTEAYTAARDAGLPIQLFKVLDDLPLSGITSFIGIVLVIVFFVTSSDSGSLVIDTITAGGKVDAPVPQRVFWACFEGLVAIVLLLGGGLAALQAMAVSTGFPFAIVLLLACYAIVRGLMSEPRPA